MEVETGERADQGKVTRRILVEGRVQGVGYRYFVIREAEALGVTGWVRNRFDGGVEVLACGPADALDVLAGRLWAGPRMAKVMGVDVTDVAPYTEPGFRVLPSAP